jgi:hypothetical protein
MALPPHVDSFKKFTPLIPDHLTASIAFGLFMESEEVWVINKVGSLHRGNAVITTAII